jgi:outer membrane receptor protein involved in Fe transport
MSKKVRHAALAIALLTIVPAGAAFAQSDTGRIEGLVIDSTGLVLPGATITVRNLATGVEQVVVSDEGGRYTVTPVRPGNYHIKVSIEGFRPVETRSLTINVSQVARLDYTLQPGGVTETVQVSAESPPLETVTSSIGTVISSQQVEDLPMNGRNFTQLATLTPGVNRGIPGSNAEGSSGNAETFRFGEVGGGALSVNGVREQFNNFLLDGVDNNESLVNSTLLFPPVEGIQEFRVTTTNAPAEFGRAGGAVINVITKSGANTINGSAFGYWRPSDLAAMPYFVEKNNQEKPDFNRTQFGGSAGGPIVSSRLFYFGEYAGLRSRIPVEAGGLITVPTQLMRGGDFSELLNPAFTGLNAPILIYNPTTGVPFANNRIPSSLIDAVGQRYLDAYPLPTRSDRYQQNYATNRRRDTRFHNGTARVDYVMSDAANLFGRFGFGYEYFSDPGRIPGYQAGFGSGRSENRSYGTAIGYNRVLSPSLVNETRIGINVQKYQFQPVGFGENQNAALGIPGAGGVTQNNGISLIGGGNGGWIEYLGDFGQYQVPQKTFQVSSSLTWLRGPHTLKTGGTFIRRFVDQVRTRFGKGFYFFSDSTATPGTTPALGFTGFEVADMLAARTQFTATGVPGYIERFTRSWENSVFVQDDWQVNSRLTLNLGLRYDVFTPYIEKNDRLANYDPETQRLVLPGQNGAPRSTVDTDWNNLGPRLGAAYQINPRTVVRGAYGMFYALQRAGIDNELTESPPFGTVQFRFDGPGANVRLSEPIPPPDPVDPDAPTLPQGSGVVYVPRDTPTSRVQQYNVSVQRQLTDATTVMAAYVGTRGDNLTAVLTSSGFAGTITERLTTVRNDATSQYNGLQLQARQTPRKGLTYLVSYTLSKATNDAPGPFPGPASNFTATPSDQRNLGLDEGLADYDRTHYFSLAATYELPWGRDPGGTPSLLLGGWQVNAILTFASGTPFSAYTSERRAKQVGDPEGQGTVEQWFNPAAFAPAANASEVGKRNVLRAPGISTVDFSLFKTFRVAPTQGVEVRVEVFNLFDTPQYAIPGNFVGNVDFGRITQTRLNTERQVQLALRYRF